MDNWQVALLTVSALVAGLAIPALWQLRATLKRFAELGAKLEPAIDDTRATMRRISRITEGFEGREHNVVELADAMGELAGAMNRLRDTTRTATAVGAAVAAAVRAFRDIRAGEPLPEDDAGPVPAEETAAAVETERGEAERGNGHARTMEEEHEQEATS